MKHFFSFFIIIITFGFFITSCEENERFSTNPALQIEFSKDTLRFDTVFTTIASPMQRMKVYNKNNNSISFESIELMEAAKSGFRINVNGLAGTKFENIDLLRKDSIYIFVDAKPNELNGADALVRDSICLKWNGNTKYIQLGAYGVDVHIWDDRKIEVDTHLSADKGYYIRGALTVNEDATLNIEEGATFYLDKKGSITINGTVVAEGSIQKPITFRGHRFDFIERNIPYNNASDQWVGITVGEKSFNNILRNVRIRNSQIGIDFLQSSPNQQKAILENIIIHNTSNFGIRAVNSKVDAVNCQITNSKGVLLHLIGGEYSFLHTTVANYYSWHPRTMASVVLEDNRGNVKYPLVKANFNNSIIVGTFRDELTSYINKEHGSSALFSNCVIQASYPNESPEFVNTIWNTESVFLFKNLNNERRFFYDFELIENSLARDKASLTHAQQAPFDLRGVSRLTNGKPDIGCYEWFR